MIWDSDLGQLARFLMVLHPSALFKIFSQDLVLKKTPVSHNKCIQFSNLRDICWLCFPWCIFLLFVFLLGQPACSYHHKPSYNSSFCHPPIGLPCTVIVLAPTVDSWRSDRRSDRRSDGPPRGRRSNGLRRGRRSDWRSDGPRRGQRRSSDRSCRFSIFNLSAY